MNVVWDDKAVKKFKKLGIVGQSLLDEEVLKSSNNYAPEDSTELIRSSVRATVFGSGKVMWDTPYARKLYWNPQYNFSSDKNPNAQGLWFEAAKANDLKDWIKALDNLKNGIV